jgi:DNA-binding SARP family transcriptional activator
MIRLARLAKGVGALALLTVLVAGIPWALWHFVGWPLPHHIPSASQVGRALNHQGIPDQALIDALAVVVWITWATLVASLAVEIPAAISGRHAPHLPVAGLFQPLTGHLVAAVIVACLAVAPRGLHTGPPGGIGNGLTTAARQPVAALIVNDPTLTAATRPLHAAPAANLTPAQSPDPASAASTPAQPASTTYVVQRGDTLWGIAERQLGDPLKWQTIYQLNEGRPQPGGVTLTDPHWIDPGWTLLLPSTPVTPPAPTPPVTTPPTTAPTAAVPAPTSTTPSSTTPASTTPASTTPATTTAPAATSPTTSAPQTLTTIGSAAHHAAERAEPVQLPSGSMVAGSFAAGVLATLALGRLRRRHTYRYRPPEPGRDLTPTPHRPTVHHLHQTAPAVPVHGVSIDAGAGTVPVFPIDDDERRLDPSRLDVGTRDGATVTIELTELSGIALCGPTVADAVRALIAALIVRAGPGAAEVLLTDDLADRLLPDLDPDLAIRRAATTTDQVARVVEGERIARTRRMTAADAPDAARFRTENPENPLPALLVLLDRLPAESLGRWEALVADAARLGIAVLFLDDCPAATGQLILDNTRTVTHANPAHLTAVLVGCQLFGLRADEAVELVGSVNDATRRPDEDELESETSTPIIALRRRDEPDLDGPAPVAEPWPEPNGAPDYLPAGGDRPLTIDVLGPYRITAFGQPVTTGLRARAKTLLAWCLLRPEGATIDEIVDALWPKTPPDRVLKQFWYPLGDLRSFFRAPGGENLEVLEKIGEHYRPNPAEITSDLWDFQAALAAATRASGDDQARAALHRAVDTYRGDLLQGAGYSWVEPVRQDLHRRAVDAHLRLAELEDHAGRPDTAIDVLERVIDLDRYAEEPYRRLMTLHAAHGRLDAVTATWKLLQRRLADLDVDTDDATANLYHALTTASTDPSRPRPIRLPS